VVSVLLNTCASVDIRLRIVETNSNFILSWPPSSSDFILESAAKVNVINWERVEELTTTNNGRCEVIDNDSYVVHPFKRHLPNLYGGAYSDNRPRSDLGEGAGCASVDDVRHGTRRCACT